MMKRNIAVFSLVIFLYACTSNQEKEYERCPLPPQEFSEAELAGTWTAPHPTRSDILIIRKDRLYKQIIHLTSPIFDYESDWLPWRIEYAKNGLPYLHMEGMRLCAYGAGEIVNCNQVGGSNDERYGYWYDACQDKWVMMPGKGILIVVGTPKGFKQPSRGITLHLLQKGEDTWFYELSDLTFPILTKTMSP